MPDIYAVWEKEGWTSPVIEEQYGPDRTVVKLDLRGQREDNISENKRQKQATKASDKNKRQKQATKASNYEKTANNKKLILSFIEDNGKAKTTEIAEVIKLSQARARTLLSELVDEGEIEAIGDRRSRYYIIKSHKE